MVGRRYTYFLAAYQSFKSDCTMESLNLRPMSRLTSNTVFFGFSAICDTRNVGRGRLLERLVCRHALTIH
eukprot:1195315-Prorocentrum_minimum.AAC.1